jgi:hypothetical protein
MAFRFIEDFVYASVESLAASDLETQKKKMCHSVSPKPVTASPTY